MSAEQRLLEMGLELPGEVQLPPGVETPFRWAHVRGDKAYVSGHGPLTPEGTPAGPFGKVPSEVSLDDAQASARLAGLAMLASLRAALGDLDRVQAWLAIAGFVNADPGYPHTTLVINPVSELVLSLFGPDVGAHARTAVGVAAVPLNLPVIVNAELEIRR